MNLTLPTLRTGLLALALFAAPAAAVAEVPYQTIAADIARGFLAPTYERIVVAADANAAAWKKLCRDRGGPDLAAVKARHTELALAFGEIQSFTLGPIGQNSTIERLYFWPERKNATARGLTALLAGEEPITDERVARASAAAQGLPALEQLLFGDQPPEPAAQARRCAAGAAISAHVAATFATISKAWSGPDGYAAQLAQGKVDPVLGDSIQQVATDMVTGFATAIAAIQDQKLEPIIGKDADSARPALAEAHLARLSRDMIVANIKGLREFIRHLQASGVGSLQIRSWDAMLANIQSEVSALDGFPDAMTDPGRRKGAEKLLADLKATHHLLETEIPVALDLRLGFNGLDGD